MPSFLSGFGSEPVNLASSDYSPYDPPHRISQEKTPLHSSKTLGPLMNGHPVEHSGGGKRIIDGVFFSGPNGINSSLQSLPNGRSSGSLDSRDRSQSKNESTFSMKSGSGVMGDNGQHNAVLINDGQGHGSSEQGILAVLDDEDLVLPLQQKSLENRPLVSSSRSGHARAHSASEPRTYSSKGSYTNQLDSFSVVSDANSNSQKVQSANRFSSPPNFSNSMMSPSTSHTSSSYPGPPRLQHRHTLQVPKGSTSYGFREVSTPIASASGDAVGETERFAPVTRTSINLGRRQTRSIHSDMCLDEIPQDDDTARWTDTIRQKRASRRQRKDEEEDDRVVVGTKVDMNHVNWVTAYNMLTGIRFTVSRTNAKIDRDLTEADFDAKHKFSFDM